MLFLNDNKNHEWSYACLMCHVYAAEAETITAEMRETIERAAVVISVPLRGCFVYRSNAEDDIDGFVLLTPGGYVLVVSSELAKVNVETMTAIFREVDQDALDFGPETEVNVSALNEKAKKRAQETREPAKGDPAELQPSLEDGIAEFDKACKEIHAEMEAAFAPIQNEFDELRKQLDNELKL